jgi:hypothetical protein
MEKAVAALTRAENDPDAVLYGENSLRRAKESLAQMQASAASKRYDEAKLLAQEVINAAEKAQNDGKLGVIRAREEATRLLSEAKNALTATEKTLNTAKELDNTDADFNGLTKRLETTRNIVAEAETDLGSQHYQDSQNKSRTARAALGDITSEISGAVSKKSRKK